jgi:putative transposase
MMHRAHKIALDPTHVQATYFARACGTARFAYNWGLAHWGDWYRAHLVDPTSPRPSVISLNNWLNAVKGTDFPWMADVTKWAPAEALRDLGQAFASFFAGRARYPTKRKRGRNDSFRMQAGIQVDGKRLKLPVLGWVRMREPLRWADATIRSATISTRCGRWFVSLTCELPDQEPTPRTPKAGGIDPGTGQVATSDGDLFSTPRAYRKREKQLRRAQQSLARKKKGSHNRIKARAKVRKIHGRITGIRNDWQHKLTRHIADQYTIIGVETLNVKGMTRNRRLAKSILDVGFFEIRRQLEYKTTGQGGKIIAANQWFPSSKLCSRCGSKTKTMPLHIRNWTCKECGTLHHRDINAATNLMIYAEGYSVSACGEFTATDWPRITSEFWSSHLDQPHQRTETGTNQIQHVSSIG